MDSNSVHDSAKKCVVKICKRAPALKWKKITENVLNKVEANGTLALYYKDHKYEYMCLNCYNAIVVNGPSTYVEHAAEWAKGLKRRRNDNISMTESISLLTNIIFEKEVIGNDLPIVTFSQLKVIAIDKNDQLGFFFNEWLCMAIPLWNLKDELTASDNNLSWVDSVNVLTKLLYDREKNEEEPIIYSFKQLRKEMVAKDFRLNGFFDSIYNASLSKNRSDKYLNKLDKKLAVEYLMGVSAEAIDVLSYAGITISRRHLDREKTAIANDHLYRVASYLEAKKDNALVLNVDDYHNIHTKRIPNTCSTSGAAHMTNLLLNGVDSMAIPQVTTGGISIHNPNLVDSNLICNFLDGIYMKRMAKTFYDQFYYEVSLDEKLENMTLHKYDSRIQEHQEELKIKDAILLNFFESGLKEIDSYIYALQQVHKTPLLTNYLRGVTKSADWPRQIYWDFFDMEYQYVFSTSKALSISPSPYRIFVLLELVRSAWKEIRLIVTDYPVENMHSIIRWQISSTNTSQQLSKIAKVVNAKRDINIFEDTFVVQKKLTYADKDNMSLLTKKAQVFLLETFGKIYQMLGQSSIVKGPGKKITYKLASLDIIIDKKQMPLGFSSEHLPSFDKCDQCHGLLCDGTGKSSMVIACGHGYYESCFTLLNEKCYHCENFLKLGIKNNVSSLLSRLSKLDKSKSKSKSKSNLQEIIEADKDRSQNQRIENEDDIL
ncbi:hypothetical protein C2G38_2167822 [Gigaspora rosea]|uniref:Uncharacterized protein n=1 Tax=Gigaspora rosea TaxID=44941 RepID=A0A397VSG6_9GLOM|nr:hypothetical protein C2G38_2167822 [Gigaspora rosea]